MARKGWDALKPGYRSRIINAGLTREDYEAGRPLKKARGHEHTPERPKQYSAAKYPKYAAERQRLTAELQQKKEQYFGGSRHWDTAKSDKHIREKPPTMAQLRSVLAWTQEEWLDAIREDFENFSFLGYH